mgnify:CR=1 FL=1
MPVQVASASFQHSYVAAVSVLNALVVAWTLWPRSYDAPIEPGRGEWAFGAWLKIARDGVCQFQRRFIASCRRGASGPGNSRRLSAMVDLHKQVQGQGILRQAPPS